MWYQVLKPVTEVIPNICNQDVIFALILFICVPGHLFRKRRVTAWCSFGSRWKSGDLIWKEIWDGHMTLPWPFRMSGLLQVALSRYSSLRCFLLVSLVNRKKAKRRTGIQDGPANQTVYTQEHMEQIHGAPCERTIVSKSGARARGLAPRSRGGIWGFRLTHIHLLLRFSLTLALSFSLLSLTFYYFPFPF